MCSSYLWKGTPNSARGAKIAWEVVCTAKDCGGLGLKRLVSWNKVFALKLIWLLFTKAGSLWVSWVRINLIGSRNFWDLNPANSSSWIWRKLCKLRSLARPFLVCEAGSGTTVSFWLDNWTGLGPLINLSGLIGPQIVGLPLYSVVRDGIRDNNWWISTSRSRNPIISLIKSILPDVGSMIDCEEDDVYLWKLDHLPPSTNFSSPKTWQALNPLGPSVSWHNSIWFKDRIPKHAFICWVVAWNRLHTRDKLRRWGFSILPTCLLCNQHDESREHLFFECTFSHAVWFYFTSRLNFSPPVQFMDCLQWVKSATRDPNLTLIIKLIFQASIYFLWKERNARLHTQLSRPSAILIKEMCKLLRSRLDPLFRNQTIAPPGFSLLSTWFRYLE